MSIHWGVTGNKLYNSWELVTDSSPDKSELCAKQVLKLKCRCECLTFLFPSSLSPQIRKDLSLGFLGSLGSPVQSPKEA